MKKPNIRKLTTTGASSSYYVTIPKEIIRGLKLRRGQKLSVRQRGEKIVIERL